MDILVPLVIISVVVLFSIKKFKPQVWKKVVQLSSGSKMSWFKSLLKWITPRFQLYRTRKSKRQQRSLQSR
jgi:hypothetical protein